MLNFGSEYAKMSEFLWSIDLSVGTILFFEFTLVWLLLDLIGAFLSIGKTFSDLTFVKHKSFDAYFYTIL